MIIFCFTFDKDPPPLCFLASQDSLRKLFLHGYNTPDVTTWEGSSVQERGGGIICRTRVAVLCLYSYLYIYTHRRICIYIIKGNSNDLSAEHTISIILYTPKDPSTRGEMCARQRDPIYSSCRAHYSLLTVHQANYARIKLQLCKAAHTERTGCNWAA